MTNIASHRGGTLEFGDSTPSGFKATARMALEQVEFDVHPTVDGAIMVHHDATLDRVTDRTGAIAEQSETEVRSAVINYSGGEHPVSLGELCKIFIGSKVDFRCEIKPGSHGIAYYNFVPQVVEILAHHGMLGRTGFSSFLIENLDALARETDRPRLWLVTPQVLGLLGKAEVIEVAKRHNIGEIGVNVDVADAALMEYVQAAGLDFGVWAAHSAAQIEKALRLKVKVFTTDRPSLAIYLRQNLTGEVPK